MEETKTHFFLTLSLTFVVVESDKIVLHVFRNRTLQHGDQSRWGRSWFCAHGASHWRCNLAEPQTAFFKGYHLCTLMYFQYTSMICVDLLRFAPIFRDLADLKHSHPFPNHYIQIFFDFLSIVERFVKLMHWFPPQTAWRRYLAVFFFTPLKQWIKHTLLWFFMFLLIFGVIH